MSLHTSTVRPPPDTVLTDIADYVLATAIDSDLAYETARQCLIDTLGCGLEALDYPACTRLLGPLVPGMSIRDGARVPGTSFELDPVQAAFNLGAMIRWLDFNDTWLAAEWGHPSDNLGAILSLRDWQSRRAVAAGQPPRRDARRAHRDDQGPRDPGRARAGERLQSRRPRSRGAGEGRVHRRVRRPARPVARAGHQRGLACLGRRPEPAHLSARAQHRLAQELGGRRCDQSRPALSRSSPPPARWAIRRC